MTDAMPNRHPVRYKPAGVYFTYLVLFTLRGGGHTLQLEVVTYVHSWLDEAIAVFDTYPLVAKRHVSRHHHLNLRPGLMQ